MGCATVGQAVPSIRARLAASARRYLGRSRLTMIHPPPKKATQIPPTSQWPLNASRTARDTMTRTTRLKSHCGIRSVRWAIATASEARAGSLTALPSRSARAISFRSSRDSARVLARSILARDTSPGCPCARRSRHERNSTATTTTPTAIITNQTVHLASPIPDVYCDARQARGQPAGWPGLCAFVQCALISGIWAGRLTPTPPGALLRRSLPRVRRSATSVTG